MKDRPYNVENRADPVDIVVGRRIRMLRVSRGITQTALGKRLGITFQQIQKYESGANRISASKLWRLCQALQITPAAVFEPLIGDTPTLEPDANTQALELIRRWRGLPEVHRRCLSTMARVLAGHRRGGTAPEAEVGL